MTTGRLNNDYRSAICRKLITGRYAEKLTGLQGLFSLLAASCYDHVFPAVTREQMDRLPPGWLPEVADIEVRLGSEHTQLSFSGQLPHNLLNYNGTTLAALGRRLDKVHRRTTFRLKNSCCLSLPGSHLFSDTFLELQGAAKDLMNEVSKAERETQGVLGSFATTKTLIEAWPELEPVVSEIVPVVRERVPAPRIAELNARLGLERAA